MMRGGLQGGNVIMVGKGPAHPFTGDPLRKHPVSASALPWARGVAISRKGVGRTLGNPSYDWQNAACTLPLPRKSSACQGAGGVRDLESFQGGFLFEYFLNFFDDDLERVTRTLRFTANP